MSNPLSLRPIAAAAALVGFALPAQVAWNPDWTVRLPAGTTLSNGIAGMVVDGAGVTYVTGTLGPLSNSDIVTAAFSAGGALMWSDVFNGPANWHDQARGLALGPQGVLWVTGNTPSASLRSNVLLLKYDTTTGARLTTVTYSSSPLFAEIGVTVATDAAGNVYVGGDTNGDGSDAMLLKFDAAGALKWKRTWDGPAFGPFSQDHALEVLVDPDGHPVTLIHGVMGGNQPDYVVVEWAPQDGGVLWQTNWGVSGGDYPEDMEIDAAGDVYVTGLGIRVNFEYSTIKLRGTDGALLWQFYDAAGFHQAVRALALDDRGGVYVTGSIDPDGDRSNNNDDFFTVKRDAGTGALQWTHSYGAPCIGCLDLPADLAVDAGGHVYLSGGTSSPPYSAAVITFVLDAATGAETNRGVMTPGPLGGVGAAFLELDAGRNLLIGGQSSDATSGAVEILVTRYPGLAGVRAVGTGCSGSGAAPLAATTAGLPQVPNPTFALQLSGGPSAPLQAFAIAGGLAAVPVPFGAPGCSIAIDLGSFAGTFAAPGGTLPLGIANNPSFLGRQIAAQGVAVDAVTGLLVTSDALSLLFGR